MVLSTHSGVVQGLIQGVDGLASLPGTMNGHGITQTSKELHY